MSDVKARNPGAAGAGVEKSAAYQAPALDKGLEILEFLAARGAPFGLADMAKALGRSKNELYRMVQALERRGYIARTADDRFALTHRLFELGMRTPPIRNLHDAALPLMHALAEQLEQSCHLTVRSGDEIVVVARVESPGLLGFAVRVGYRRHVTDATSGALIFGLTPPAAQQAWLKSLRRTAPKGADIEAFLAAARAAAARAWAMTPSSSVAAIVDLAAPIYDGLTETPVAVLTIPFLSRREEPAHAEQAGAALVEAAARITQTLKFG